MSGNQLSGNFTSWVMPNLRYLALGSNHLWEPIVNLPLRFSALLYLDLCVNQYSIGFQPPPIPSAEAAPYSPAAAAAASLSSSSDEDQDLGAFLFNLLVRIAPPPACTQTRRPSVSLSSRVCPCSCAVLWWCFLQPPSVSTLHLEQNQLDGQWSDGFLPSFLQLSNLYLSHNRIRSLPNDILGFVSGTHMHARTHADRRSELQGPTGPDVFVILCACLSLSTECRVPW